MPLVWQEEETAAVKEEKEEMLLLLLAVANKEEERSPLPIRATPYDTVTTRPKKEMERIADLLPSS